MQGSGGRKSLARPLRLGGFTVIELLIVVSLIFIFTDSLKSVIDAARFARSNDRLAAPGDLVEVLLTSTFKCAPEYFEYDADAPLIGKLVFSSKESTVHRRRDSSDAAAPKEKVFQIFELINYRVVSNAPTLWAPLSQLEPGEASQNPGEFYYNSSVFIDPENFKSTCAGELRVRIPKLAPYITPVVSGGAVSYKLSPHFVGTYNLPLKLNSKLKFENLFTQEVVDALGYLNIVGVLDDDISAFVQVALSMGESGVIIGNGGTGDSGQMNGQASNVQNSQNPNLGGGVAVLGGADSNVMGSSADSQAVAVACSLSTQPASPLSPSSKLIYLLMNFAAILSLCELRRRSFRARSASAK